MRLLARLRTGLPDRRTCSFLALCVAAALFLDFLYYTGFFASDDVAYLQTARQIAQVGDDIHGYSWTGSIANTRLGITVPAGILYWLSDGDIALIACFHVIYHLLLVVLAYAIGRELDDPRTGLLAAALVAVNPILYVYAGGVLPDNATAVWLGLLLLLLLRARRRALEARLSTRASFARYFVAGLVLGAAYSCKETALIMTVPCAVVIIASAPRLRSAVWIRDGAFLAAGLLVVIAIELLVLRAMSGSWLCRLGGVEDSGDVFARRMETQGSGVFERFSHLWWRRLFPLMPVFSVVLLAAALAYPLLRRRNLALIAFFWWPLIYMTIGSTSFSEYRPSTIQDRYYAITVLPAAVMAAIVLATLIERSGRRWAATAIAVAIAVIAVDGVRRTRDLAGSLYSASEARAFTDAYQQVRVDHPGQRIVLSKRFQRRMSTLLYPRAPEGVWAHRSLTSWGINPELPFILLSPPEEALPEGRSTMSRPRIGEVDARTLGVVYPVRGRFDILGDDLRRVLGLGRKSSLPRAKRGAVVIQLVTAPVDPPPP